MLVRVSMTEVAWIRVQSHIQSVPSCTHMDLRRLLSISNFDSSFDVGFNWIGAYSSTHTQMHKHKNACSKYYLLPIMLLLRFMLLLSSCLPLLQYVLLKRVFRSQSLAKICFIQTKACCCTYMFNFIYGWDKGELTIHCLVL